ncbi:ABC transporter substrate-binding protein [Marinactinospora thermotolerans]|uniref:Peptide/nickel transport system substrate-binding protein n=1 Tax=Marinactinospora thermotolerans DSM 45154 TaxID=1122192 RepID=A0A1T4M9B1_9ACTN|nr:ABC transporter substrate-binding protein [Marinactinospora thermotolerans]SJZ63426.1 peptide/nickel transport system substrate-binding protein [Marinactinospora thermotolerans DSM 45154]
MTPVTPPSTRRSRRAGARSILAAATALVITAAGCSSGDYGSTSADSTTFTYLSTTDIMTEWDPAASYSNEIVAFPNMYETLTRYNSESGEVEPLLATEWSSSDDGLTWTFTLREGVTFHSGEPMTAASVKKAIERTIEVGAGAAYLWSPVEEISTPDDRTVEFKLSHAAPLDLISAAAYGAYIYEVPENEGAFESTSHGTGPYTVSEWKPGEENELTLTAYEGYWGGWEGEHYEQIAYRVVPQASTAAQLITSGEAHYAQALPTQLLEPMHDDPSLQVIETASWQNLFGLMNTEKPPLDDKRVRQAIAHAIDYDALIEGTNGGFSESEGVIPEGLIGHQEDPGLRMYDPDRAEQLLEEAGYGPDSGEILTLNLTYTEGEEDVATMASLMQSQLASVNIELQIEGLPWESAQWPKAQEADPEDRQDILLMYWWPDDPQPLSWYQNLFRTEEEILLNLAYYSNPELDKLIDEVGPLTATDPEAAERTYAEMQEILNEDAPALFLGNRRYQRAVSASVEGFRDEPMYANVPFVYDYSPA